jgi:hypothetical protein
MHSTSNIRPLFLFLLISTTLYTRMTPSSFHTMYLNALAPTQLPNASHGISECVQGMLAYIVSPDRYRAPTSSELAELLSTAFDKYYVGMVWLIEAAVAMFSCKGTGPQVVPCSYPLEYTQDTNGGSNLVDNAEQATLEANAGDGDTAIEVTL